MFVACRDCGRVRRRVTLATFVCRFCLSTFGVKNDLRMRDAQIWLLRRGDNLRLVEIGKLYGLSTENVRQRVQIMDRRITKASGKGLSPKQLWRLRAANAITRDSYMVYEAFNSTKPTEKEK